MRNSKMYIIGLLFFGNCLCGGLLNAQLNPTRQQAVVTFVLSNPLTTKAWNKKTFEVEEIRTQRRWSLTTNAQGIAEILLPIGQDYTLHLADWEDFAQINVPKEPFSRHRIPMPCYDLATLPTGVVSIPVHLQLVDSLGAPTLLKETLLLRGNCGKGPYKVTTDEKGRAVLPLPIGCQYVLNLEGAPSYYKFKLPNKPYANWTETILFERLPGRTQYASVNEALFNFIFTDLDGEVIEGEAFWMLDKETGKRYEATTNAFGIAQILVPLYREYTLHATHNKHFAVYSTNLAANRDILVETIYYESMSTFDWKKRRLEQAAQAQKRDSLSRVKAAIEAAQLDSIKSTKAEEEWLAQLMETQQPIPIKRTLRIRKAIRAKTRFVEEQIQLNPRYSEESKQPILAVLQRHKALWKGKVVVTDVTESMRPYLDQVLIWHQLRLQKGEPISYVFFNDGNHKMASAKKIGETGGLYACRGVWQDVDSVLNTMGEAMACGLGGGEPPENDLEAVLFGIKQREGVQELVLIADSYSRVRDMDLLYNIKIPVRIILCGAEEQNSFYPSLKPDINEEYLTIAHRTKGSIHTLRQDILDISATKEGEIVQIGAHRYLLSNRQFIKLEP
ncbi:MAG: hypothetical protein ACRBFS_12470 [Aureispira sp.]